MTRATALEPETDQKGPLESQESKPAKGIRILLADSQAIYRVGMRKVFALEEEMSVVGQADSLDALHTTLKQTPADVMIVEAGLIPDATKMLPELSRLAPNTKLIVQVLE